MWEWILLACSVMCMCINNVGSKTNKAKGGGRFLNVTITSFIAAVILWIIVAVVDEKVSMNMLIYALIFAVFGVFGKCMGYLAYEKGSMLATTLFSNSSLIVVVVFGVFFFQEPFELLTGIGIIGVIASLVLFALAGDSDKLKEDGIKVAEKKKHSINFIWLLCCLGIVLANSAISISTKIRQVNVGGANVFAYMALCYTLMCIISALVYGFIQIKATSLKADIVNVKACVPSLLMQSFGNAGCNVLVTILAARMLGAVLYPVNTGGGLVLTVLCGFLFFKEKKTWKNILGIALGIVSIVILSL